MASCSQMLAETWEIWRTTPYVHFLCSPFRLPLLITIKARIVFLSEPVENTKILIITERFLEEDISCGWPGFYSKFHSRDHFIAKLYTDKSRDEEICCATEIIEAYEEEMLDLVSTGCRFGSEYAATTTNQLHHKILSPVCPTRFLHHLSCITWVAVPQIISTLQITNPFFQTPHMPHEMMGKVLVKMRFKSYLFQRAFNMPAKMKHAFVSTVQTQNRDLILTH